jgi:hypothetical protein
MFRLDGKLAITDDFLERHIADVVQETKTLFYVDPSWGAEIGVLCTAISRLPA